MIRLIKYYWYRIVMIATHFLGDVSISLKIRGILLKPAFKKCGRNLQVSTGAIINWSSNIEVGDDVFIANYCWIQGVGGVELRDKAMLGPFTVIASNNHTRDPRGYFRFGPPKRGKIILCEGCWTGAHAVVTAGVTIGEGAAVAANGVATKDVPKFSVVAGVPAKVIKEYKAN